MGGGFVYSWARFGRDQGICCDKVGVSCTKPSIATRSQKTTTDGGGTKQRSCSDCHCVRLRAGYGEVGRLDHPAWMGQAYVGDTCLEPIRKRRRKPARALATKSK